jgi:hypothetical protein
MHTITFDSRDAATSYALMLSSLPGVSSITVDGYIVTWFGKKHILED